jgi:hypothetical protein
MAITWTHIKKNHRLWRKTTGRKKVCGHKIRLYQHGKEITPDNPIVRPELIDGWYPLTYEAICLR